MRLHEIANNDRIKERIADWCERSIIQGWSPTIDSLGDYEVREVGFTVNDDLTVSGSGRISLSQTPKIGSNVIKFKDFNGSFIVHCIDIKEFNFMPEEVVGELSIYGHPKNRSLQGLPKVVDGFFKFIPLARFSSNDDERVTIKNFDGCPREVSKIFSVQNGIIHSLRGVPREVGSYVEFVNCMFQPQVLEAIKNWDHHVLFTNCYYFLGKDDDEGWKHIALNSRGRTMPAKDYYEQMMEDIADVSNHLE